MVSSVIGARRGFIQRYKLIKKVKTGRGARPDDGELTFKCILNKRDFEFVLKFVMLLLELQLQLSNNSYD